MAFGVGAQGQVNSAKKTRKYAPIMTSPARNQSSKLKYFFLI